MIRKYHTHTPQTNRRHRDEEQQNTNSQKRSGRQLKQASSSVSLPRQDD